MYLIGITGITGSGKTTISKILKTSLEKNGKKVTLIDVDEINREAFQLYPNVIASSVSYLNSRYGINIHNMQEFWEKIMDSRSADIIMCDPLYFHICSIIDEIMIEQKEDLVLLDWAMLPKSKYFNSCDLKILIKPSNEEKRKLALQQRGDDIQKVERRDRYKINYGQYEFDQTFENDYSGDAVSNNRLDSIRDSIIK